MDDIKTRDFRMISKLTIGQLRALPMFKAHEKDTTETAMAMATGKIPVNTAYEAKQWKAMEREAKSPEEAKKKQVVATQKSGELG
jgi:hypothetical protein